MGSRRRIHGVVMLNFGYNLTATSGSHVLYDTAAMMPWMSYAPAIKPGY
jgi:hypothetical protein